MCSWNVSISLWHDKIAVVTCRHFPTPTKLLAVPKPPCFFSLTVDNKLFNYLHPRVSLTSNTLNAFCQSFNNKLVWFMVFCILSQNNYPNCVYQCNIVQDPPVIIKENLLFLLFLKILINMFPY